MTVTIRHGDCREVLPTLPDQSVHCCVTSPPYFGLRSYGIGIENGEIGLEATPDAFVAQMVAVFREVRRVLRDDGTLWLNLGDSYCSTDKWGGGGNVGKNTVAPDGSVPSWAVRSKKPSMPGLKPKDLIGIPWRVAFALQADGWYLRSDIIWSKPNPMPESVIDRPTKSHEYIFLFSKSERYFFDQDAVRETVSPLQQDAADDRVLREKNGRSRHQLQSLRESPSEGVADIGRIGQREGGSGALRKNREWKSQTSSIWPESQAADLHLPLWQNSEGERSHVAGEQILKRQGEIGPLFSDDQRQNCYGSKTSQTLYSNESSDIDCRGMGDDFVGRERAMRLLQDGKTADDGSCNSLESRRPTRQGKCDTGLSELQFPKEGSATGRNIRSVWTIATQPFSEAHFATFPPALIEPCIKAGCPIGGTVLDPFAGAGTTGMVADRLQRNAILIELNPEYSAMSERRICDDAGMFAEIAP